MAISDHLPGCTGKKKYVSRQAAKQGAKNIQRTFGKKQHIYECSFCPNWHLTSSSESREGARVRNEKFKLKFPC